MVEYYISNLDSVFFKIHKIEDGLVYYHNTKRWVAYDVCNTDYMIEKNKLTPMSEIDKILYNVDFCY